MQTGHPQEAIEHCQRALRLKSDYPEAHNFLGNACVQTGRPLEAIEHFREALRIKPDYPEVCNNLGSTLLQSNRPKEAIVQFKQALVLRPNTSLHYIIWQLLMRIITNHPRPLPQPRSVWNSRGLPARQILQKKSKIG